MSFTNRINYSLNITGGNLIVGGSSSIGNMSAASGSIQNFTSTNITTNSLVGTSASLSGSLTAPSGSVSNLNVTNASASSFVGSNANLSGTITTGNLRVTGNRTYQTDGNLTISGLSDGKVYRTNIGQLYDAPNTFYINSRGDTDQPGAINLMVNNSSGVYISQSGNVGINNTNPLAPLHFANTVASRKIILWRNADNDHQFFGLGVNPDTFRFQVNGTTSDFVFYTGISSTNSNELMRIKGTGNVGIGTNNPQYKLDVNGNCRINTTSGYLEVGGLRMAGWDTSNTIYSTSGDLAITANDGNNILFKLHPSGEKMRISSSGYVGIGVSSPGSSLDVRANAWGGIRVLPSSDGGEASFGFLGKADGTTNTSGTELGNWMMGTNLTGYGPGFNIARNIPGNPATFTITNSGNVGIGTTDPSHKLTVYNGVNQDSSMVILAGHEYNNASLYLGTPFQGVMNRAQKTAIIAQGIDGWSRSNLHFCLNNDGTSNESTQNASLAHSRMTITNSGNVGIGTTSPNQRLHVVGNINFTGTLFQNGNAVTTAPWGSTGGNIYYNGGNVGIGTTSPGAKLDVRGNLYVGGNTQSNFIAFFGTNNDGPGTFSHTYIGERIYSGTEASELLLFKGNDPGSVTGPDRIRLLAAEHRFDTYTLEAFGAFNTIAATSGTTRMIITNSGNVGVGTANPTSLLHVSGGNIQIDNGAMYIIQGVRDIDLLGTLDKTGMTFNARNQGNYARFDFVNNNNAVESNQFFSFGYTVDLANTRGLHFRKGGLIGINTTSPNYTLDINGTFEVSNSNGLLLFASTGNLGIGTTSPIGKLTVKTNTSVNGIVHTDDTITLTTYVGGGSNSGQLGTISNHPLGFFTNNAAVQMVLGISGNVGIGTNNPVNKLSINGPSGSLNGPHTWVTNTGDPYPVFQQLNWGRDNINLLFDNYYDDSATRTSSTSTAFQITKHQNRLNFMFANGSAGSAITPSNAMCIGSSGNVGIGTSSPSSRLHVSGGNVLVNGYSLLINPTTSTNDAAPWENVTLNLENPSQTNNNKNMIVFSGQRTGSGQFTTGAIGTKVLNYGTGGENCEMLFYTTIGGTVGERMKLNTAGNLGIGTSSPNSRLHVKSSSTDISGAEIISYFEKANEGVLEIRSTGFLWQTNAANACLRMGKSNTTNRSINATGTINANGADYAEYMIKNDNCGIIAKGDICGIDGNSQLTDNFDEAIAFAVKSTNPSYVGGDNWGGEDLTGPKPQRDNFETEEEYNSALSQWEAHFEELRSKVDRIAFCGIVPVNVLNATPGDYIIPTRTENGGITGICVSNESITFQQFKMAVGLVVKVAEDGRAVVKTLKN